MRERAKGEKPANGAGRFRPPGIPLGRCRGQAERRRLGRRGGWRRRSRAVACGPIDVACGVEWNGLWTVLGWASGGLCWLVGRVKSREQRSPSSSNVLRLLLCLIFPGGGGGVGRWVGRGRRCAAQNPSSSSSSSALRPRRPWGRDEGEGDFALHRRLHARAQPGPAGRRPPIAAVIPVLADTTAMFTRLLVVVESNSMLSF